MSVSRPQNLRKPIWLYLGNHTQGNLRGADHNAFLPQGLSLTVLYSAGCLFYSTNHSGQFSGGGDKQVTGVLLNM